MAREGEEMARAEVAAMVVAEVAMAGIKVGFFTRPTGPTYPSMAGWGSPAGSRVRGWISTPRTNRWHQEHVAPNPA